MWDVDLVKRLKDRPHHSISLRGITVPRWDFGRKQRLSLKATSHQWMEIQTLKERGLEKIYWKLCVCVGGGVWGLGVVFPSGPFPPCRISISLPVLSLKWICPQTRLMSSCGPRRAVWGLWGKSNCWPWAPWQNLRMPGEDGVWRNTRPRSPFLLRKLTQYLIPRANTISMVFLLLCWQVSQVEYIIS